MDTQNLKECLTDALRYWEPRRLLYNALLAAIVIGHFFYYYPETQHAMHK